jgi:hypothetical protein
VGHGEGDTDFGVVSLSAFAGVARAALWPFSEADTGEASKRGVDDVCAWADVFGAGILDDGDDD